MTFPRPLAQLTRSPPLEFVGPVDIHDPQLLKMKKKLLFRSAAKRPSLAKCQKQYPIFTARVRLDSKAEIDVIQFERFVNIYV